MNPSLKKRAGISLVIVLGSLVLLSALVVAFLGQMGTELKSSKLYAEGSSARVLSDSATNLVMAMIKEGTKGGPNGRSLAWASQPGAITTFDASGRLANTYKLYSDDEMIDPHFTAGTALSKIPEDWRTKKSIFTDLNEPVYSKGMDPDNPNRITPVFPIINGDLQGGLRSLAISGPDGARDILTYDSDADLTPDIEGFFVDSDKVPGADETTSGPASQANPIPMPVKWLYVLSDGSIVTPREDQGKVIIPGAADSPIVGRIAFWTDDETCKINLNSASEGSYWDSPKVTSKFDRRLALNQPAQKEYQRYSGHPATTSLSTVFQRPAGMAEDEWAEKIYSTIPRIVGGDGSSKRGTVSVYGAPPSLLPDSDRLFASVDEFLFNTDIPGTARENNPLIVETSTGSTAKIRSDKVTRSKFFLTASSRAPDVSLFNLPRVCLWPIYQGLASGRVTAFDRLIAFCETIGGHIYYFQRSDPTSSIADLPTSTTSPLYRNRDLLSYLRRLMSAPFPGFGNTTFVDKYGQKDVDQISTEMMDYIRSCNLSDTTLSVANRFSKVFATDYNPGQGQAVPIYDSETDTRGFGRFPTIQGATLLFYGASQGPSPLPPSASEGNTLPADAVNVRAIFFVNLFIPSYGWSAVNPMLRIRVDGLQNFRWQKWTTVIPRAGAANPAKLDVTQSEIASMDFSPAPTSGTNWANAQVGPTTWSMYGTKNLGGSIDFFKFVTNQTWSPNQYKLISGAAMMPKQTAKPFSDTNLPVTFGFLGGTVTLQLIAPGTHEVVQTVQLNFPDALLRPNPSDPDNPIDERFPVPYLAATVNGRNYRVATSSNSGRLTGNHRYSHITKEDTVRSIVPAEGDLRIAFPHRYLAHSPSIYAKHSKYHNRFELQAHNLRTEDNAPYYGASSGRLLKLPYGRWTSAPYTQNNYYMDNYMTRDSNVVPDSMHDDILGDWDNGPGGLMDGPYINKPDEGNYGTAGHDPYYGYSNSEVGETLFSPNRIMPSAGMFGSLPTGVWDSPPTPWQTLVFSPHPLKGPGHIGLESPPDHLLMDLFHMPVVEPYAISEPLSTAGRINMNYQIVPFTYINRDTGIRAVLKSDKVIAIEDADAPDYKRAYPTKNDNDFKAQNIRFSINADETLKGFNERFQNNEIFKSASEICQLPLVPENSTYEEMKDGTFWRTRRLTGDNSRERPYTTVYPRLTTKSNTYTIHVRAQSLKKRKGTGAQADEWEEGKDQVTGEYRGHQTIERYVDPNDSSIPDYVTNLNGTKLSDFYKFRVIETKQFAP